MYKNIWWKTVDAKLSHNQHVCFSDLNLNYAGDSPSSLVYVYVLFVFIISSLDVGQYCNILTLIILIVNII